MSVATTTPGMPHLLGTQAGQSLSVLIRKSKAGPALLRKPISRAELLDFQSEAWHHLVLRKGAPQVALDEMKFELLPHYHPGQTGTLSGFALATIDPAGKPSRYEFTMQAVENSAHTAVRELTAAGVLQATDEYFFELVAEEQAPALPKANRLVEITISTPKLNYLEQPIGPLRSRAEEVGPQQAHWAPVFYTEQAFQRAKSFARRGGNQQPPIETGCMLIGALCSCPETGEFYVVIRDALEAQDADSKKFSLEYTGQTWSRMQKILRVRQMQSAGRADRFVGQAHGHPFSPAGGAPPCELCTQRPDLPCSRTSCFVSTDDSAWSSAVFARQPWQLCHIFGLNARNEHVHKLFGLCNGQLLERGFSIIPDFSVDQSHSP